ncbi:MAG TPA: LuxR C-terminal-related transcriptional regulator, partial [Acidimicrobiia bacterium]|nr:LuxR C-terminal-related transcriptional regulator [Acidimicrobiia bacterium]
ESAVCSVFGVDLDGAMREASEAVEQAEKDENAMALILGLSVQSFASTAFGDSASALELATRAATVADTTPGGEGHRVHPNLFRGIALQSLGRHTDARRALDHGRALGEALGSGWALPIYHFLAALAHWDRGEWDDLLTEIDAGLSHSEERAFSIGQAWAYGTAGRVYVHRGQLDKAVDVLDKGDQLVAERGAQFGVDWIVLARALLLETQGRRAEGLDLLRLVWEAAAGLQASASLVLVGGDLARLAVESGDDETGAKVASELALLVERSPEDLVVRGRERRARGLVDRDSGALREATGVFEQLGHRFEAAVVRAELAELLLAQGDTGEATRLFEQSLSDYDDISASPEADRVRARLARLSPSGERRPAPRRAVTGWEALTPTEHEVVEEVCGGRSNPQVAERLGISRRTVEAHLRSIYAKLGVSTRLALAVAYREREPVSS